MRRSRAVLCLPLFAAAFVACYHATVETGLTPSTTVIDQAWASGWVFGLVAPKPVESMSRCPGGVAKVETELSFVNMLVGNLTLGIFTPMHIRVTCAMAGQRGALPGAAQIEVSAAATPAEVQEALGRAAELAMRTLGPVYVRY